MQTVRDILNSKGQDLYSVTPDVSVFEALERLEERNIGVILVIDTDGTLLGIFSERDYARKIVLKGRHSKTTPVREVMTRKVSCVSPDTTVETCMALMTGKRIRHLPVLEDGRLIGLVSIGDVVKATIEEKDLLIDQLEHYIMGSI
jgi:CBS domain-containing protein